MYTFIAYKPTSHDYIYGEIHWSDHVVEINLDYDNLVKVYGKYLFKNKLIDQKNNREEGYEFWIFEDGKILDCLDQLKNDAEVVSKQLLKEYLQEKILAIRKKLEKEEAEKKERRRLQFEELKKEFS